MLLHNAIELAAGIAVGFSLFCGLLAAHYWRKSAQNAAGENGFSGFFVGPEGQRKFAAWLADGAKFNRAAAIWTAFSVLASGVGAVLDHIAP